MDKRDPHGPAHPRWETAPLNGTLMAAATGTDTTHHLVARIDGGVSYACPACHALNVVRKVNWRWPVHRCNECNVRWRFGLAFFDSLPRPRPGNGWVHTLPPGAMYVNTYNNAAGDTAIGDVTGTVHFSCPACRGVSAQKVQRCHVTCTRCDRTFAVGLRLWKNPQGRKARTPYDWFFPKELIGAAYVHAKDQHRNRLSGHRPPRRPRALDVAAPSGRVGGPAAPDAPPNGPDRRGDLGCSLDTGGGTGADRPTRGPK